MKNTLKQCKNRDLSVEILRILAMMIVVGVHIKLPDNMGTYLDTGRIFISCILADGVAVFFMILGFFLFGKNNKWPDLIKKSLLRILLPLVLVSAFTWYLGDFFVYGQSIYDSIFHSMEEYKNLLRESILEFKNIQPLGGHLWYLYVYFGVVLIMPALKGIKEAFDNAFKRQWIVLMIFFILLFINDITVNKLLGLNHLLANGVIGAGIFVIAGAVLYENKEKFIRNYKYGLLGIGLFFISNIIRVYAVRYYYEAYYTNHLEAWYTSFGFINVISLFMVIFGFSGYIKVSDKMRNFIGHFAKVTFYIYLIHILVVNYLLNQGVAENLQKWFGNAWIGDILYMISFGVIVIGISWAISEVLYVVVSGISKLINVKCKGNNE